MAITKTTSLGPNSVAINYAINADQISIMNAIEAFITTKGWSLWDEDGPDHTKVFRSINSDNTSYKYINIDISDPTKLFMKVYEGWDAVTHTGLNITNFSSDEILAQQLSLPYGGYIYLFATSRWLLAQTKINDGSIGSSTGSSWTGCIEISRDNADEVPGDYPIFAFSNGNLMMGNGSTTANEPNGFALCRTIDNDTGVDASKYNTVSCLAGMTYNSNSKLCDQMPKSTNPLSASNDIFVLTPYALSVINANPIHIRGRFYGIKLLSSNLGSFMDKVNIKTDSSAFYSTSGVDTEHHILTNGNQRFAIPA